MATDHLTQASVPGTGKGNHWRPILILSVLTCIVFSPTLGTGLFLDDATNYLNSREAAWTLESLGRAFRFLFEEIHDGAVPKFLQGSPRFFRPLTVGFMKLETTLLGTRFWCYHLVSILLQVLIVVQVFLLGKELLGDQKQAFRAAFLYLFFPQTIITVVWLSTTGDLLCTGLSLAFLRAVVRNAGPGRSLFPGILSPLVFMVLALLSKESAAALPLLAGVLVFHLHRSRGEENWSSARAAITWFLPMSAVFVAYFALRTRVLGGVGLPTFYFYIFPPDSPLLPLFCLYKLAYLIPMVFFFFPVINIRFLTEFPVFHWIGIPLSLIVIFAFFRFIGRFWGNDRIFRLSVPCFFLGLLPTLPLLPFPHYFSLPSVFICLILVRVLWPLPVGQDQASGNTVSPEGEETPGSRNRKRYMAFYFGNFVLALGILVTGLSSISKGLEQGCQVLLETYDSFRNSEVFRKSGRKAEFYLVDAQLFHFHLFSEFRLRYPDRPDFKGCILNVTPPLIPRTPVEFASGTLTLKAPEGYPFFSGFLFSTLFGKMGPDVLTATFSCDLYRSIPISRRTDPATGFPLVEEIRIEFDPRNSEEKARFFFWGIPRGRKSSDNRVPIAGTAPQTK